MYHANHCVAVVQVVSNSTSQSQSRAFAIVRSIILRPVIGLSVTGGLISLGLSLPAIAIPSPFPQVDDYTPSRRDYDRCTSRLLSLNITVEEATSACARSLQPSKLSRCVTDVTQEGGVEAAQALGACRQVRRPDEMGLCVQSIRRRVADAAPLDVVDNCRRSLLPERYANCVVGTITAAKYPAPQALTTCIDGTYFPREVDPTFIPYPLPTAEVTAPSEPVLQPPTTPPPSTTPTPPTTTPQLF